MLLGVDDVSVCLTIDRVVPFFSGALPKFEDDPRSG